MSAQEAPYKFDLGGGIGMSGYLGDVNESNMFKHPGLDVHAQFRYIANARWAIRTQLAYATYKGDSEDFNMVFPDGETYSFSSSAIHLDVRGECNFLPFGIGETYKRLSRWTPYVAVGVGASLTMGKDGAGNSVAFTVPLSVGVKYKLKERLNISAEFTFAHLFGDKLDGDLTDLYRIKSSFVKNNDWYSAIGVSLTYEFGKRCETCNRID